MKTATENVESRNAGSDVTGWKISPKQLTDIARLLTATLMSNDFTIGNNAEQQAVTSRVALASQRCSDITTCQCRRWLMERHIVVWLYNHSTNTIQMYSYCCLTARKYNSNTWKTVHEWEQEQKPNLWTLSWSDWHVMQYEGCTQYGNQKLSLHNGAQYFFKNFQARLKAAMPEGPTAREGRFLAKGQLAPSPPAMGPPPARCGAKSQLLEGFLAF